MDEKIKRKMSNFQEVKELSNNYIKARGPKSTSLPFALFNSNGEQLTSFIYDDIEEKDGIFIVSKYKPENYNISKEKPKVAYGIIDFNGKEVLPTIYQKYLINEKYIIVNEKLNKITEGSEIYSKDGKFIEYLPKDKTQMKKFIYPIDDKN